MIAFWILIIGLIIIYLEQFIWFNQKQRDIKKYHGEKASKSD